MRAFTLLALVACGKKDDDDGGPEPTDAAPTDTGTTNGGSTGLTTDPGPHLNTTGTAETCAVMFGGNDRVRAPDEGLPLGDAPRTAQGWIRTSSMRDQVALSHGRPSPKQGFLLGTDRGRAMARTGNGSQRVLGDTVIADDRWHHVAASWDGHLVVLVVDGEIDAVAELEGDTLEGDLVAGNTPTGDNTAPWIGWLDDLKLVHGNRLPEDIAADPDGILLDPDDVLVWWDFEGLPEDGGPGLVVPDLSGHGYDGLTAGEDGMPAFPACR